MSESKFEELLDAVLRKDAQVEPLTGLEERVMKRMIVPPQRRSIWRSVAWGLTVATPVCLVAVMLLTQHRVPPQHADSTAQIASGHPPQNAAAEKIIRKPMPVPPISPTRQTMIATLKPLHAKPLARGPEPLPKLDVFPAPAQVPEPVRELAELSHRRGVDVSGLTNLDFQGKPPAELKIEPITIATIEIKPLFPLPDSAKKQVEDHKESK